MPTPHIFEFDTDNLADYEPARIAAALEDYPSLYVNHLQVAEHLAGWADRLAEERRQGDPSADEGFVSALREVVAHLRQADYLPSGVFLRDAREMRERAANLRR